MVQKIVVSWNNRFSRRQQSRYQLEPTPIWKTIADFVVGRTPVTKAGFEHNVSRSSDQSGQPDRMASDNLVMSSTQDFENWDCKRSE